MAKKSISQSDPASQTPIKFTAREQKLLNELVTVHGVRSDAAIYVSDSMTGYSWTCRVHFSNGASGHLFSVPIPVDEDETKIKAARDKFYAKVRAFKTALNTLLVPASNEPKAETPAPNAGSKGGQS